MKKLILICASSLLIITACTKKDCYVLPPHASFIIAEKGGEKWAAAPEALKIGTDSMAITGRENEAQLSIRIKFTGKGNYTLKGTQAKYYITVGQDAMVAEYVLDTNAANKLEVFNYDTNKGIIDGTFSLTLKKVYANPENAYPNQIKFLNGQFSEVLPK